MSVLALKEIQDSLGAAKVRPKGHVPVRNWTDSSGKEPVEPLALVLPTTVEEISTILAICHRHAQPVVTQGGLTGLAGGAHPSGGEIAISLERMSGIEEIDPSSATLTALAGTPLQVIQDAAASASFICPIDLGARGSCTIGGNVATNAGGNQVLRYGMTRKSVLGLEVVLADGTVVRNLNKMIKNNAGYDWTQLFIGSEGTLGIITRVTLALQPMLHDIRGALIAVDSTTDAISLLRSLQRALPAGLLVFEAMWREFYEIATTTLGIEPPLECGHDLYLLVEAPSAAGLENALEDCLATLLESGSVRDGVVAKSEADRRRFWALRESVYEYHRHFPPGVGFDISLPLDLMNDAIAALRSQLPRAFPGAVWVAFGHLADSNIHLDVIPREMTPETYSEIERVVYDLTGSFKGSISAEHGIGQLKRRYLDRSRAAPELALMKTLKSTLDPSNMLNRGRVI
jgi:FAD/FMN-containing dehydrogenase